MQAAGADVGGEAFGGVGPGFGDEGPVAWELVGDRAPGAVDVVDLVAVPVRMRDLVDCQVGEIGVLGEPVGDVDAEPVDAPVEPEPQDGLELGVHVGVLPVEVGLFGGVQVEVPLAVGQPGPGRAAEFGDPVVGRLGAVGAAAGPEDVTLAFRAAGARVQCRLEPDVLVGGVVGHDVGDDADPVLVGFGDELLGVGDRAEQRVDGAEVGHVVTAVRHRGLVPGVDPQGVHAE